MAPVADGSGALGQCLERLELPQPALQRLGVQTLVRLLCQSRKGRLFQEKEVQICVRHRSPVCDHSKTRQNW